MEFFTILVIAVGLSMDAFAVALGVGTAQQGGTQRAKFRISFHFGLFQALMTSLGWLAGSAFSRFIDQFDHWVAFGLLAFVGANMIRSGLKNDEGEDSAQDSRRDPSRGHMLVLLSVATSLDAMAVGLSMAMLKQQIILPAAVIGITTLLLSLTGMLLGKRLGETFGKRMEIIGGIILLGIGLRVLYTHLF